jgi:hypothetical protein
VTASLPSCGSFQYRLGHQRPTFWPALSVTCLARALASRCLATIGGRRADTQIDGRAVLELGKKIRQYSPKVQLRRF